MHPTASQPLSDKTAQPGWRGRPRSHHSRGVQAADALADGETIDEACAAHSVYLRTLLGSVACTRLPECYDDAVAAVAAADVIGRRLQSTVTPAWLSQARAPPPPPPPARPPVRPPARGPCGLAVPLTVASACCTSADFMM